MFALVARCPVKTQSCLSLTTADQADRWHCRYGHLSWSGLKVLQQKNMVEGLPKFKASKKLCEGCLVGKQHRDSFPRESAWRALKILQLIHADICGPINPISNSKKRYLITFIDDYSRRTWVYFLVEKSEAFAVFKMYKAKLEKEIGAFIRSLRMDRGGEFTSHEFTDFCNENGIHRQLTAAYTPQQNGIAEQKNRTIMNMVRCMLSEKHIPKTFWPESVNWAVHMLNRSPTLAVKIKTPEEAWSGRKPSVEHFRVFGCISHVHVPDSKRVKLDDKSIKCILLGVNEESKAYRLFNPVSNKIIISRDVVFEEDQQWIWDESHEEAILADLDEEIVTEDEGNEEEDKEESEAHESNGDNSFELEDVTNEGSAPQEGRARRPPIWMRDYDTGEGLSDEESMNLAHLALFTNGDPTTYCEAMKSEKWKQAMDREIKAIEKNNTWELTDLPSGGKTIGVKWVFKTKLNENGEVDKYKAQLVAKGYSQQYGVDFSEVFALVARLDTIRVVISLVAQMSWKIYQLDVKSAFLHGEINEEVFVEQPPGYE
ncbi:hypothetical protein COP2_035913 [Malus domestica]